MLYEPLMQYLCQVNRLAKSGAPLGYGDVRGRIVELLQDVHRRAEDDASLMEHMRALDAPVKFFVDDVIAQNPRISFSKRWHAERLGFAENGLAGDEAFFVNHLDPELESPPSQKIAERLLVYYVCLGLGFQGYFFNEPERLRGYIKRILPAVRPWLVESGVERLVPQAYEHTDTRDFVRPPELRSSLLLAGVFSLLLAGFPLYAWLAKSLVEKLETQVHLREISESYQGTSVEEAMIK